MRANSITMKGPTWLVAACLLGAGLTTAGPALAEPAGTSPVAHATAAEPAHSLREARTHVVVARNSWQRHALVRKSQKNWYRIELTSRSYLYTLLGDLPANYNLRLYDNAGEVLSKSDRSSLRPEKLGRSLGPGTYFLRVASTSGSDRRKKYAMQVRVVPASATVGVLTARVDNGDGVVGDLVNVSKQTMTVAHVDLAFYGANGKVLRRLSDTSNRLWIPMAPGTRAPFKASTSDVPESVLRKTKRVTVVPRWSVMPTRPAAKLSVSNVRRTNKHHPSWTDVRVTGRIQNKSGRAVPVASAVVQFHNKRGVLIGLEEDSRRVPANANRKFSTSYFSWTSNPAMTVKAFETVSTVPDPE